MEFGRHFISQIQENDATAKDDSKLRTGICVSLAASYSHPAAPPPSHDIRLAASLLGVRLAVHLPPHPRLLLPPPRWLVLPQPRRLLIPPHCHLPPRSYLATPPP